MSADRCQSDAVLPCPFTLPHHPKRIEVIDLLLIVDIIDMVKNPLGGNRLGAFQRQTQSTVPEDLRQGTQGTGDAEKDSVVVELLEAIVPEEDTGVGVHVGVRVLGLPVLGQHIRHNLVSVKRRSLVKDKASRSVSPLS